MLKRLNKIIVYGCFICCLTLNSIAIVQNPAYALTNSTSQEQVNVKDIDNEPLNTQKVKQSVVPDTKKEGKKLIGLFLKTMAGVAFSAVLLYVILVFVKKYYGSAFVNNDFEAFESLDLATPQDKQEALKSFLNRTK